jgi:co-chaperonin GroES (HSP10)
MLKAPYDKIIIKCLVKEEKVGSIIVPESMQKQERTYFTGQVVAIGEDYPDDSLKVGDTIVYPPHEGVPVIVGDETFLSLKELWVLARVVE